MPIDLLIAKARELYGISLFNSGFVSETIRAGKARFVKSANQKFHCANIFDVDYPDEDRQVIVRVAVDRNTANVITVLKRKAKKSKESQRETPLVSRVG